MAAKGETNTKKKGATQKAVAKSVMAHDPLADLDAGGLEQTAAEVAQSEDVAGVSGAAPVSEQDSSGSGVVAIGATLTIADVAEWRSKMVTVFDRSEPVQLDGSELGQIDGAGIQFLVAVMQEAAALGIEISWTGVSEVLRNAADLLGLSDTLHLSEI